MIGQIVVFKMRFTLLLLFAKGTWFLTLAGSHKGYILSGDGPLFRNVQIKEWILITMFGVEAFANLLQSFVANS